MILGDNNFYGNWLRKNLYEVIQNAEKGVATIFGYYVKDLERFGVDEFDDKKNVFLLRKNPLIKNRIIA
jgi:glucose-1-phosphate thymidylyltransferase